ncbi:MAG: hypothetical protein JWL90_1237 [Chthoniobacteraceae bacterium]|nr:hypothetical protein [Chthoniobacteraceae bacterium]
MSSSISLPAVPRVTPNPWNAFGGIWRLTARRFTTRNYWIGVAVLLSILALFTGAIVRRENGATQFFSLAKVVYLTIMLPLTAFVFTAAAVRDDLKPSSVDYVFTRPIRRTAFVLFKYLSQMICLQIDFLLAFAILLCTGIYRHVPGLFEAAPILLFAQVLLVMAFSAFGFFCGVITSRYMVVGLIYAAVVEVGVGQLPTQLSKIAVTRQILGMIEPTMSRVAPRLSNHAAEVPGILATVGLLSAFTLVMISLAALFFSHQELSGGKSPQA